MQLLPKINFVTSLYVHIENLAVYHKWSSRSYPKHFTLSQTAIKYIRWYKKFRKAHFIDTLYEEAFVSDKLEDAFSKLHKLQHLQKTEKENLVKIFLYFEKGYEKAWHENADKLRSLKKSIPMWWKEKNKKVMKRLNYVAQNFPRSVTVFLFWNPFEFKATALGKSSILIETNFHFPEKFVFTTIPHELGHLMDISYGLNSLSMFRSRFGLKKGVILHEAVISLLFPVKNLKGTPKGKGINPITIEKSLVPELTPIFKSSMSASDDYQTLLARIISACGSKDLR